MDSGNSGSMQSSSGGDEEYDSSNFLNNNPSTHFGSISSTNNNNQPSFLSHQPNFFDSHSQNLDNTSFNNDLIWPRGLRSDHNNFNNFGTLSSASSNVAPQVVNLHHHQNPFSTSTSLPIQSSIEAAGGNVLRASNTAQPDQQPNVVKNPKKRTRASRRAPTTVLTTDTTNFRQMVQEFTGIPTAPFTGSAYTRRLDLFSTAGSAMRSGHLDSLGPLYPLRPSAQKVQVSPFMPQLSSHSTSSSLLSSSMIDALMPTNNSGNNSMVGTTCTSTSTSANFQLGSDHLGIQKQAAQNSNNLFNMQNQILSFQPLVQSSSPSLKNPLGNEQLGISHEQVSANISGFHEGGMSGQVRNDGNISRLWRGGNNNASHHDGGQENQLMRSFDGNNNNSSQHASGYKLNSTSEFHPEKGLENVCSSTGNQGQVSSWTCPPE